MRTDYDVIFLGSSCFALGCAARNPEKTLILESGEGLGGEFVDSLSAGQAPSLRPEGEAAAFYDDLIARGIASPESLAQGRAHVPAIRMVLNRMVLERGLNLLFHMRVLEQEPAAQGVRVRAVCNAKIYTFTCRRVVDTRSDFARVRALDAAASCELRANLYAPEAACVGWENLTVHPGFLPEEAFLAYPVERADARLPLEALLSAFERRPAAALDLRILTVAHTYAMRCRPIREKTPCGWFIPGCGNANPVQAFAAGLAETEVFA